MNHFWLRIPILTHIWPEIFFYKNLTCQTTFLVISTKIPIFSFFFTMFGPLFCFFHFNQDTNFRVFHKYWNNWPYKNSKTISGSFAVVLANFWHFSVMFCPLFCFPKFDIKISWKGLQKPLALMASFATFALFLTELSILF